MMISIKNGNKQYEEYRRLWDMATKRELLTKVPLHLDIELTNRCNLKCDMCWHYQFLEYQKGIMDFELYKKIIKEGVEKGVQAIKLQSRGEAMLHPKIIEAIKHAKKAGIIDIHLTTNATLLDEKKWEDFLKAGLDVLNFSLDPAHKKSFEELNGANSYENVVINNITGFLKLKKKLSLHKPFVKIQTLESEALDLFKSQYIDHISGLVDKVVINPVFSLVEDVTNNREELKVPPPCSWLWQRMVINFDGKVTICCRDYNCVEIMGDVTKQTLDEIWNGKKFSEARKLHTKGMRNKISFCAACVLS